MKIYEKMLNNLTSKYEVLKYWEDFRNMKISVETSSMITPTLGNIKDLFTNIAVRDDIRLKIFEGDYEICSFSKGTSINSFFEDILKSVDTKSNLEFKINIDIIKNTVNNEVSIYDLDAFITHISNLSLKGALSEFNNVLKNNYMIFLVLDGSLNVPISTKYICFTFDSKLVNFDDCTREKLIKKRSEVSSFLNAGEYDLVPEDFHFLNNIDNVRLSNIFEKLKIIISLIYISGISNIEGGNIIAYRIEGYKWKNFSIDYTNIDIKDLNIVYDIYYWIYNDGNLSDKIGLSRNVISLHLVTKDKIKIDKSTFEAIKSNYGIYLKDNVKQYIEIKGRLTQSISDLSQDTDNLVGKFVSTFKNNLVAGITFFMSILVMNSIYSGHISNIFVGDIIYLSIGLLLISSGFLVVSKVSINRGLKRLDVHYRRLKGSYDKILDENDIKEIFKDDEYHKEDIEYVNQEVRSYSWLWIVIIIIFLIIAVA